MQYNYYFHFHHQLVHESLMLDEFESLLQQNVHNGSWHGKPSFLPPPHLISFIDSQISGKRVFHCSQKYYKTGTS